MIDELGRVTIIAVGCCKYQHMRRLTGPAQDIDNLRQILVEDEDLSLFSPRQYIEKIDITSNELRAVINDYVYDRGAENDILLFYFSGHGAPIGSNDFAFCTIDTKPVEGEQFILPMTAVKFTDILSTLWLKKVTPVFIIDACYSGAAGGSLKIALNRLVDDLKGEIQRNYAGSYALLCSAPTDEEVLDNPDGDGGFFSYSITKTAQMGIRRINKRNPFVSIEQVYPELLHLAEQSAYSPNPTLFMGTTLPTFSIFKNIHFRPLEYRLQPHLVAVLRVLWNNGNLQTLTPGQIADQTGKKGAYGNHNKLSLAPWKLVEDVPGSRPKQRRLSERGIEFMSGNLGVPRDVVFDQDTNDYVERPGSEFVTVRDFA
ncbi:MAG: caspase family protein [Methylobacter sp.]|nr:caspase family protein [Methylobacter sp.]